MRYKMTLNDIDIMPAARVLVVNTNPEEFKLFHDILTKNAPANYQPFYFPLEKGGKNPLPNISWKNNRKTFNEAYNLMEQGYNIGIAATATDELCIMDADDIVKVGDMKPTLTIMSRKQIGKHGFYFTKDELVTGKSAECESAKQNIPAGDAGEIRAVWYYVVACGSYCPCTADEIDRIPIEDKEYAGHYRLSGRTDVVSITYSELPQVYKDVIESGRETEIAKSIKRKHAANTQKINTEGSAIWDLSIYNVTGLRDRPGKRFGIPTEFHGSGTDNDCSVTDGLLHCWRHKCYHTGLTALAVIAGIASCSEAGVPHHGHGSSVDFKDRRIQFELWVYAYNHGLLPIGDKIPYQGLVYYVLNKKLCNENQLIDGWKLPGFVPRVASLIAEKEGINFGR